MRTKSNAGFTVIELAVLAATIFIVLLVFIGVPIGGAYLTVAAANLLFGAGWKYDASHIILIAAIILFSEFVLCAQGIE